MEQLVDVLNSKPLGLLMILPQTAQKDLSDKVTDTWNKIQDALATHRLNIPIYFTFEDEDKLNLYEDLKSKVGKAASSEGSNPLFKKTLHFDVKGADPVLIHSLELPVVFGVLKTDEEIRGSSKPLILVTASYDFLSVVPGMGKGINAASGMMGVFDLSRLYAQLLEDPKLRDSAEYDFMFVLTPGSFINHELSGQFVESLNYKLREKIKFVL